jgi:transaldolase
MKVFLDTANISALQHYKDTGLIDGVTTNPSNLSKEGGDPVAHIKEICALFPNGDISVEITESLPADVYKQAHRIKALAHNVVVKIPAHKDYFPVIQRLVNEGVPVNVTLVFSLLQGLCMAKLGVKYISPFIGRLDDIDDDGIALLPELRHVLDNYTYSTQILAASMRSVHHVHQAALAGVDAVTMPPDIFAAMTNHPLTDQGMALFAASWAKLGVKQFP